MVAPIITNDLPMDTPLVTIVVPCFNHAQYIRECIDSILRQTYPNIELIVIDDGSSDGSAAILAQLAQQHGFYFEAQTNQGLTRTLNKALAMAKGKYFCNMGSDDVMLPNKTAVQVQFMEQYPQVAMCCGNALYIDENGDFLRKPTRQLQHGFMDFEGYFGNTRAGVIAPSAMLRTSTLREVGGYDPDIRLEDLAMWLKLTHAGYQIGFVRDEILHYRKHPTNTSKNLRFMYESHMQTYAPYRDHPRYPGVINRYLISTLVAAAKRDQLELARELAKKISPRFYDGKFLRGMAYLVRAQIRHWFSTTNRKSPR